MKVISGLYKGRNIEGFDLDGTRPTMERVKESLFAIIQNNLQDSIVLDLFSGSGNLGIEALSQGAKYAYLVDSNPKATKTIKRNLENINIKSAEVINMDYIKALNYLKEKNIKLDIIFLDPPYKTAFIEKSIELITNNNLLNKDGLIICESDSLDRIVYNENYKIIKDKKYGDKWVVILKQI
ncbi:MAG: 16S rRNA (guanine(966)-N(2))-methyltransferase RsmD [Bacilli bacterium]|nr:16S rRNA (guanine(966)-N(2))-methyltransferase RsmD [Bacilli bacterium]